MASACNGTTTISRRALIGGAAAALALPACTHRAAQTGTLETLVARHVAVRGGAAALDRVRNLLIDLEITEGGQTIEGRYAAEAGGNVRIDIRAGGALVYSEGFDRNGVWLWPASEPAPRPSLAEGAANALQNGAENHLFGLHRFPERGHRLRLMPTARLDGADFDVVEIVYASGHKAYFYLDPTTSLIARRRDERAYHPDLDLTRQRVETRFSDHQNVEGVLAPHRNVDFDLATGAILSTNQVKRRAINATLPAGLFERTYRPA